MKSFFSLLCCLFLAVTLRAEDTSSPLQVDSKWPGVHFVILKVVRCDASRVLITVQVTADSTAAGPTVLALPGKPVPAGGPDPSASPAVYDPQPFSLVEAYLLDPRTENHFPAEAALPSKPFVGPNRVLVRLLPGSGLQMGVSFAVPAPPPPPPGEKAEPQKVDLYLPHASGPIRGVLLPQS